MRSKSIETCLPIWWMAPLQGMQLSYYSWFFFHSFLIFLFFKMSWILFLDLQLNLKKYVSITRTHTNVAWIYFVLIYFMIWDLWHHMTSDRSFKCCVSWLLSVSFLWSVLFFWELLVFFSKTINTITFGMTFVDFTKFSINVNESKF